ncbi:glycosyltransferase family 4 protein [Stutzerimonas nitrititolerans]|uniref:glycosyltransferase family 4 protein n=1 Tax=Stutzerimonas nitrititolerans TaxID=2482751 RepID=UPI0028B07B74|nr:glycosyltransferase family 4 protein [Stutzerimonas nitrititolerans]
MKIALISQNASPGILIFRKSLIEYMVGRGCEVYALALDYTPESKLAVQAMGAIPVDYSLSKAGLNPVRDARDIISLASKLKEIQVDVLLAFFVKPSIYGSLAGKIAGIPRRIAMLEGLGYIHTLTASGFSIKKRILQYVHGVLSTIGYSCADKVFFLNHDDPKDLSRVAWVRAEKIEVLGPVGLDLKSYPYRQVDITRPLRFIFVARLLAEKGTFEFLEAARIVKRKCPAVEFVVLGGLDKDNPSALSKEQLDSFIDDKTILYPGHVENVADWLSDAHVFVLPSYREGFPRSTQEAMAIGRAVITTDVPGCRETVLDGANGFLVPPWDPIALAEKMFCFVERPELALEMGGVSYRKAVQEFDSNIINEKVFNIIKGMS